MVDTLGLLLAVVVHSAKISDQQGARWVLALLTHRFPRLRLLWTDGNYTGPLVDWALRWGGWVLEAVKRPEGMKGFQVLPRRWVGVRRAQPSRGAPLGVVGAVSTSEQGLRSLAPDE